MYTNFFNIFAYGSFFFTFSVTFRPDFWPSGPKSDLLTLDMSHSVGNGAMSIKTMPHCGPSLRLDATERFI